jgi:CheY-like chemotaxis protein
VEAGDLPKRRVLLLGGRKEAAMTTLRSVLTIAGITNIVQVEDSRRALDLLSSEDFDAVFCGEDAQPLAGRPFAAAARAHAAILNPMIPIFEVHERPSRRDVEEARDRGASGILTCPISPKTLVDKLAAALSSPRPFVAAPDFFGPDRRAPRPGFRGQERRLRAPQRAATDAGAAKDRP